MIDKKNTVTLEEEKKLFYELLNTPIEEKEKFLELGRKYPIPPEVAMIHKEVFGVDYIKNCGFNFSKVEEKYGKDWLSI